MTRKTQVLFLGVFLGLVHVPFYGFAFQLPAGITCKNMDRSSLPPLNSTVMSWKFSTQNGYKAQALVHGKITQTYLTRTNSRGLTHTHFAIDLDEAPGGDLEVIYNDEFGALPPLKAGIEVGVCGQYITANAQSNLPSPMGAIIHWAHYNPGDRDGGKQPDGFIVVNGKPYGFQTPQGSNPYRRR